MGNESKVESNCSRSDSSSNSAESKDNLEEINCRKENVESYYK